MSKTVDFHSHSTASDGTLSPLQLIQRAAGLQLDCLALTDHDTLAGVRWLQEQAPAVPVRLVAGCEISCTWGRKEFHVVALGVDPDNPATHAFIERQSEGRRQRSRRIASKLASRLSGYTADQCMEGALTQARQAQVNADPDFVLPDDQLQTGRPHFAAWMVQEQLVPDRRTAFERYLRKCCPGGTERYWASLQETATAIKSWNALAVLAHPGRYRVTATQLRALLKDFAAAGGTALEVIGCRQPYGESGKLAALGQEFGLCGSMGSDFHAPGSEYIELGRLAPLPAGCPSVVPLLEERDLL